MTETRTHTFTHTYRQRIKCPGGGGGGGLLHVVNVQKYDLIYFLDLLFITHLFLCISVYNVLCFFRFNETFDQL
jgi:hypothetical protein